MKCPVCADVDLSMSERQGIEIDYCPKCRGVWLDRGELDKIIERSGGEELQEAQRYSGDRKPEYRGDKKPDYYYNKKKKGGLIRELFDF